MATVYLSPTGSDSYTYAQAQNPATPWLTPGKVQASATSGDTVSMAAGIYTWASVAWTKSFNWIGAALANGLPTTVLNGGAAAVAWSFATGILDTFTRIRFTNAIPVDVSIALFYPANGALVTLNFVGCCFDNIQLPGTGFYGGLFENSFITGGTLTLSFVACVFYGLSAYPGASAACLFYHSYSGGSWDFVVTMNNCVIYHSATGASKIVSIFKNYGLAGVITVTIKNLISKNAGTPVDFTVNWTLDVTYSCMNGYSSYPAGTGNITSNPLLVDPTNNNFNTRPDSPCRGTGVAI